MDGTVGGVFDSLPGAVYVGGVAAGDGADLGVGDAAGDEADGLELRLTGDGEAAIEGVEAHVGERTGDLELLFGKVVDAGGLLAVAQGGLEELHDAGHGVTSFG